MGSAFDKTLGGSLGGGTRGPGGSSEGRGGEGGGGGGRRGSDRRTPGRRGGRLVAWLGYHEVLEHLVARTERSHCTVAQHEERVGRPQSAGLVGDDDNRAAQALQLSTSFLSGSF